MIIFTEKTVYGDINNNQKGLPKDINQENQYCPAITSKVIIGKLNSKTGCIKWKIHKVLGICKACEGEKNNIHPRQAVSWSVYHVKDPATTMSERLTFLLA